MVLGPEEGMALAGRLGLAALFIERTADGPGFTERSTPAFDRLAPPAALTAMIRAWPMTR